MEQPAVLTYFAPLASLLVGVVTMFVLLKYPNFLLDHPNQRSLHQRAVPRTGGISIVTSALVASVLMIPNYAIFYACVFLVAILSLVDDWISLRNRTRLGAQLLVSALFVFLFLPNVSFGERMFIVVTLIWFSNLFNFMDGADGLAGGMAVIGFGVCAIGAWVGGNVPLSLLCATIACACISFLVCNFHPAKIFMGDVGSVTLGFSAAAIGSIGWSEGTWSPFFPIFAFSLFIADASLTLLRRALQRKRFWEPHREHYYQKLVQLGYGHRQTALLEYALMTVSAVLALFSIGLNGIQQLIAIIGWGVILMFLGGYVDSLWARHSGEKS